MALAAELTAQSPLAIQPRSRSSFNLVENLTLHDGYRSRAGDDG